jgi:hypothetical protein
MICQPPSSDTGNGTLVERAEPFRNATTNADGGLLVGAACAPLIAHVGALAVNFEPGAWLTLTERADGASPHDRCSSPPASSIVCAPVFGVVVAGGAPAVLVEMDSERRAMQIRRGVLLFSGRVCPYLTLGWRFGQEMAVSSVARSHVTLAAAGRGTRGVGRTVRRLVSQPARCGWSQSADHSSRNRRDC